MKGLNYFRDPETGLIYRGSVKPISRSKAEINAPHSSSLLTSLLKEQMKPVVGTVELNAVGLATSLAYNCLKGNIPLRFRLNKRPKTPSLKSFSSGKIKSITVILDRKSYKNSFLGGIPQVKGLAGIKLSAAIGLFCDPGLGLNLFRNITKSIIKQARKIVVQKKIKIKILEKEVKSAYLEAQVTVKGHNGKAVISTNHNVTLIKFDSVILYKTENKKIKETFSPAIQTLSRLSIKKIIKLAGQLNKYDHDYIKRAIRINQAASKLGMKSFYGLGVGHSIKSLIKKRMLSNDLATQIQLKTVAAVDARMAGGALEVMAITGSPNQGITAMLPIISVAEKFGWHEGRLIKAVALSHLLACYTTYYTGYLTPLCGCFLRAGLGASAGIVYYLKGNVRAIEKAINNLVGNVAGVICDGAKVGCSVKVMTAANVAWQSALLALQGVEIPAANGLVSRDAETTIKNLGLLSRKMAPADQAVIDLINAGNLN